jgi:hypothetical protein
MSKESRELANAERKARYEARKAEIKANHDRKMAEIQERSLSNKEALEAKKAEDKAKAIAAKEALEAKKAEDKAKHEAKMAQIKEESNAKIQKIKSEQAERKIERESAQPTVSLKETFSEAGKILRGEVAPPPKTLSEKKQAELAEKLKDPKFAAKYGEKQAKEAATQAAMEKAAQMKTELKAKTGKVIFKQLLGLKRLIIFENGYVQVGLMGTPEKLLSVDGDINIVRKGAFGRTAGGLAGTLVGLGPVNMLSPSNRGDLSLTIVTDVSAHSFHDDVPMKDTIKAFREAELRCKALLKSLEDSSTNSVQESASSKLGLSEELEKISKLKEQGLLSEEEFAAAKAKLISG